MAFYTGRTGSLLLGSKTVAKVRDWSLETTVELLSTTTLGDFANTFVPGLKSATGSATLMYYRLEDENTDTTEEFTALLNKVHKSGEISTNDRCLLRLRVTDADSFNDIQVNAYITSATISINSNEVVVVPINFTVDGDFIEIIDPPA
jgi:hypothetical protein